MTTTTLTRTITAIALFTSAIFAARTNIHARSQQALFLLAGDSTTATQTYPDHGGGTSDRSASKLEELLIVARLG